jgi:hypothetical protein
LGLLEVGRADRRREPAVNRLEQRARLLVPALAMPVAGETDGDAQLPQATILAPRRAPPARTGVSVSDWTDDGDVEVVVGQSILNGIPVQLKPVASAIAGE